MYDRKKRTGPGHILPAAKAVVVQVPTLSSQRGRYAMSTAEVGGFSLGGTFLSRTDYSFFASRYQ